jgi:hypothetical protein
MRKPQTLAVTIRDRTEFLTEVVGPRRDIKPLVKFMIAVMETFINAETGICVVGAETLARCVGCSERSVNRMLVAAKAASLIDYPPNKGGRGLHHTNSYVFVGLKYGGVPDLNPDRAMSGFSSLNPDKNDAKPCQNEQQTLTKTTLNPDRAMSDVQVSRIQVSQERRDAFFDDFWKAYPKRLGANPKAAAEVEFQAAVKRGVNPKTIIAAVRRYAAEQSKLRNVGTQFVKQAQSWLEQQRWNEYPAPVARPSTKITMEAAVIQFAETGVWSRNAPVPDQCLAPPELMAKHGMLPDGRKKESTVQEARRSGVAMGLGGAKGSGRSLEKASAA